MKKSAETVATRDGVVPKAMQVQLARLFGSESKYASKKALAPAEWQKTLKAVLKELDRYVAINVDTDELHRWMLSSGLAAAERALDDDNFWPGYAEGITRLALLLLGDYPDHRKQTRGRNKDGHYSLKKLRFDYWVQTPEQRFQTFWAASIVGYPKLSTQDMSQPVWSKYSNRL